jgi:hypothetical protein
MGRRLVPYNPHLDKISLPSFLAWYRAWELSPSWPYSRKESEKKRILVACLREMGYGVKTTAKILGWHPFSVRYHLKQADENVWREARSIVRRWRYVREP